MHKQSGRRTARVMASGRWSVSVALAVSGLVFGGGCAGSAEREESSAAGGAQDAGQPPGARADGGGAGPVVISPRGCNQLDLAFESRRPTVMLLVDRSSSMFDHGLWDPLKTGVLEVVARLQTEVRFGFTAYTGQQGGMCPDLSTVGAATDNVDAIRAAYDALRSPPYKGETPTSRALERVTAALASDADGGPKFILLVTDGEPDFCDDANVTCARDAVVAAAQDAHRRGIGTLVFHVGGQVERPHLEDVARAGSGASVADRGGAVAGQCPSARGAYADAGEPGVLFEPDVRDRGALVGALSEAVAGLRSCAFDLAGSVQLDPAAADQGIVEIDGERVPYGGPDGYRLHGTSTLELLGAACERLRSPRTERVRIDFPCEAVIVI